MLQIVSRGAKIVGGLRELGRRMKLAHTTLIKYTRIPAERVADFARVTGIPREEIRPDIFSNGKRKKK